MFQDTYGYLYTEEQSEITSNDDYGVSTNFKIITSLEANTKSLMP